MADGKGVITRIDGKTCEIHSQGKTYRAYIPKKIRGAGAAPGKSKPVCVGDRIQFSHQDGGEEVILEAVEQRTTKLSRRGIGAVKREQLVVSNVDQLLVVTSIYSPPFHPGIIDRFLVASTRGGLAPLICVNKIDLLENTDKAERILYAIETYRKLGYTVLETSTKTKQGIAQLASCMKDKSTAVCGHSGVGKSSLLLSIDPNLQLVTKEVSEKSKRGQHATTSVTLLPIAIGGYVVDTPGIREFSLWEIEAEEINGYFPEMLEMCSDCRYRGCTHSHEPGCAIKKAVEKGEIARFRYDSYRHIMHSILHPDEMVQPGEEY